MSQNYTVNYNINVNSQAALSNIVKFQQAITALKTCESQLASFEKKMQTVNQALNKMSKSHGSVKIGVKQANRSEERRVGKEC